MSNDNLALLAAASYADFKNIKNTQSIQKALSDEKNIRISNPKIYRYL